MTLKFTSSGLFSLINSSREMTLKQRINMFDKIRTSNQILSDKQIKSFASESTDIHIGEILVENLEDGVSAIRSAMSSDPNLANVTADTVLTVLETMSKGFVARDGGAMSALTVKELLYDFLGIKAKLPPPVPKQTDPSIVNESPAYGANKPDQTVITKEEQEYLAGLEPAKGDVFAPFSPEEVTKKNKRTIEHDTKKITNPLDDYDGNVFAGKIPLCIVKK